MQNPAPAADGSDGDGVSADDALFLDLNTPSERRRRQSDEVATRLLPDDPL